MIEMFCSMVVPFILEFPTNSIHGYTRSPMSATTAMEAAAPMEATTTVETTTKARLPAGGKAPDISAVIEATECAGACSWLSVRCRIPVKPRVPSAASVKRVDVVEVVAIDDRSTVGDIGVVIVDHPMAVPVPSPVIPAPPKSSEETDSKSSAEVESRTAIKDSGHGIPTWIGNDGIAVYEPRVIRGNVDYVWNGRFDCDRIALSRHVLLLVAI